MLIRETAKDRTSKVKTRTGTMSNRLCTTVLRTGAVSKHEERVSVAWSGSSGVK